MKIIYRAWDGTEFDTEEECLAFEENFKKPLMCNASGKLTEDYDCAFCVYVRNEDEAEWFKHQIENDAQMEATDRRNFSEYETKWFLGFWYWDENRCTYRDIDTTIVDFMKGAFEK